MAGLYRTRSGDVWDNIAKEVYGSEAYTSFLMENNQKHLEHFIFPEGVELVIKEIPEKVSLLPEWRT